ncbi:MAG TPA: DUF475 domain-containing protein, partial [Novosphingobium sp.]|nr:DUF475 domain-containing protein [Novosphingobium sp.]
MSLAAALRRHLLGPALFTLLCLALAGAYSWQASPSVPLLLGQLWVVVVLAVLEVSLSFDNAVVNAALLADMDAVWRKRFLTWGMVFAVFGTRILFPLAIVGLSAGLDPVAAVRLSLTEPARYEEIVTAAHLPIAGFGGAFLALVGLRFFLDQGKQRHWLRWLERPL